MANVIALTGGGYQSVVAAAQYRQNDLVILLHISYGQRSARAERRALDRLVDRLGLAKLAALEVGYLPQLATLSGKPADPRRRSPKAAASPALSPNAERGLAPVLLALGVQAALQVGAARVVLGLSGDADASPLLPEIEPAQREEFVYTYNQMLEASLPHRSRVQVDAPLVGLTGAEVLRLATRQGVPLECTWDCHTAGPQPCGQCPGCTARGEAFRAVGHVDPLTAQPAGTRG